MTEPLSRDDVIELLKKLGSERDEDVLEAALEPHQVEWFWVKGHAGHPENERAD